VMSVETISEPVETLLKQVFKGDEPDWPEEDDAFPATFLDSINSHGLTPIFWYWINQYELCKNWPSSFLSSMKNAALQEVASDMLVQLELKKVLKSLDNIGIHPLLIKGTPLSYSLYPTSGLRPRCDTDFLIPQGDFDTTAELMMQRGYQAIYDADVEFLSSQKTFTKQEKLKNHA